MPPSSADPSPVRHLRAARSITLLPALCVILSLAACSNVPPTLPADVTVNVKQYRSDRAIRQLQVQVVNGSSDPITVTSASWTDARFDGTAEWQKDQTVVPAGLTRDLKVTLPAVSCAGQAPLEDIGPDVEASGRSGGSPDAESHVDLGFTLSDGREGTATVVPTDTLDDVARVVDRECLYERIATTAALSGSIGSVTGVGRDSVAHLDIAVRPTGEGAGYTIERVASTVLLDSPAGGGWPVAIPISAGDSGSSIRLDVVPNRCDPHAVAEDKVGTLFPVTVHTPDGHEGTFTLPLADGTRAALLDFVATHCGFGD